ncbi:diaminopimelate epimerase [Synechococcus sp. CS-1324]|uniref:diaminopimelate epimerase n=1 Tax=Synechococcus sp. CS-1324 TaxID=2847980 RepID=UPI000DB7C0D9|nr:diaminopimelate epimerase [Synechococcus sp. CS-1324]MCT0231797.1 diaminopimelate epimerase [Synechococcus sp. CS-1324]PZV05850.1 MAG: diaminopimelate epimerase [Cyanobium sp.]
MLAFSKYQGLGNDFLLLDGRDGTVVDDACGLNPGMVRRLCDRRFGIGADGVILALPPEAGGELRMRIFNADGSEAEMCGNGIRCLARFLADSDGDGDGRRWQVETLAGRIVPQLLQAGEVQVDMGEPLLEPAAVPTTLDPGPAGLPQGELEADGVRFAVAAVGMGNPHLVIPVASIEDVELERFGPLLEVDPAFPARTNVHFVEVLAPDHLLMKVWERGAGPTLACGTGACAVLVACHRLGLCGPDARIDLPGGSLRIHWDPLSSHVFMDGPAEPVFDGVLAPRLLDSTPATASKATSTAESQPPAPSPPALDCSVVCVQGCIRPEDCPSAEARARVTALLSSRSLDDLVALAMGSIENRSRARQERDDPSGA